MVEGDAGSVGSAGGRQLRIAAEVADWLAGLRRDDPAGYRAAGEAVLALLEAAPALGPPLVMPVAELGRPADRGEALDYTYERLLEHLQRVRRGVADVATSRKRRELQAEQLEQSVARLDRQVRDSLAAGRPEEARKARTRRSGMQAQLGDLQAQFESLTAEERKLTAMSQRMQVRVDEFRIHKETAKARDTAASARTYIHEAVRRISVATGTAGEAGAGGPAAAADDTGLADADAAADAADAAGPADAADAAGPDAEAARQDTAAADERLAGLLEQVSELAQEARTVFRAGREGTEVVREPAAGAAAAGVTDAAAPSEAALPPDLMTLRAGADGEPAFCLVCYDRPPDGPWLLAVTRDDSRIPADLAESARRAADLLERALGAEDHAGLACYDAESFLDEFYPGSADEVRAGAAALAARHRAYLLAQARDRLGLTPAALADRMGVSQARVAAIERAGPGETEVRALAAYVRALGGHLEIAANLGSERIVLR